MRIFGSLHPASGRRVVAPALALFALAFLLIRARREIGAQPPADPKAAAGEKALTRLRELGAQVLQGVGDFGQRQIDISFDNSWKGDGADLGLLNEAVALGEVRLNIDFHGVAPREFSAVSFPAPVQRLYLSHATDQTFKQLKSLPRCRNLTLTQFLLTPAGCRSLAPLATEVETLCFTGERVGKSWQGLTDDGLAEFSGLENLKELAIFGSSVTDAGLKPLVGMKRLERLQVAGSPALRKSSLETLAALDSLHELHLHFHVSASAIPNIARLESLKKLSLSMADVAPADLEPLTRLTHLQELAIGPSGSANSDGKQPDLRLQVPLGNAIARVVGSMPSLRIVSLRTPINHEGLAALTRQERLWAVTLNLAEVDDRSLELLSDLVRLRQLSLQGPGRLSDGGPAHLGRLTRLVELELPAAGVTDAGLSHLAGLTELEYLTLPGSQITGTGLSALGPLQKLTLLALPHSLFDDAGCRLLPRLALLETLDLSGTKITDAGMESIAKVRNLIHLDIDATEVSDVGLAHLNRLKKLWTVSASDSAVSLKAIIELQSKPHGVDMIATRHSMDLTADEFGEPIDVDGDKPEPAADEPATPQKTEDR